MIARHMLSFRAVLVASPALIDRLGMPAYPSDLAGYPTATWASRIDGELSWELGGQTVRLDPVLTTKDYDHLCRRALDGNVVAELFEQTVR